MDTRLERPRPQRRRMQQSVCSKLTGAGRHRAALIYLQNALYRHLDLFPLREASQSYADDVDIHNTNVLLHEEW